MRYVLFFLSAVAVVLGAGCGNSSFDTGNPLANLPSICEEATAPAGCGEFCATASSCASGTFCQDGVCDAVCTPEGGQCGSAGFCSSSGRCIPFTEEGGTGGIGGGSECQSVAVTPTRSIPNVMFLVDQSGSMNFSFPDSNDRWEAARAAIVEIVGDLDEIVRFGLTTYTSDDGNDPCPLLPTQIGFAFGNSSAIGDPNVYSATYPTEDGDETPTGESLDALVSIIENNPPPNDGPTIIVLATDGEPDTCAEPNPQNGQPEAVAAAASAHQAGIDVFVLWVGNLSSDSARNHLQEVANVGVGKPVNESADPATFWVGDNPTALGNAFSEIIANSISCEVEIDKPFANVEQACQQGDVRLNGSPITCPNGWRVKPGANNIIELVGDACTTFKNGVSTLTAEFPCGAVIVD